MLLCITHASPRVHRSKFHRNHSIEDVNIASTVNISLFVHRVVDTPLFSEPSSFLVLPFIREEDFDGLTRFIDDFVDGFVVDFTPVLV